MKITPANWLTSDIGIEIAELVISINFHSCIYISEIAGSKARDLLANRDDL